MSTVFGCDDRDVWTNAILVALATHPDPEINNLASGYSDAEIDAIALGTPVMLQTIVRMVIDEAVKEIDRPVIYSCPPEIAVLAAQLKEMAVAKRILKESLAKDDYKGYML